MTLFFNLFTIVTFLSAIMCFERTALMFLSNITDSRFLVIAFLFNRACGYFMASKFLHKLLNFFGYLKTFLLSIIILSSFGVGIFYLNQPIAYCIGIFFISFLANLIILNLLDILNANRGSLIYITLQSLARIISALLLNINFSSRIYIMLELIIATIIPYLARHNYDENVLLVKRNQEIPSLKKVFKKYSAYFITNLAYLITDNLLSSSYVLITFKALNYTNNDFARVLLIMGFGRFLFHYPLMLLFRFFLPLTRLIICSILQITCFILIIISMEKNKFLFHVLLFFMSALVGCRNFVNDYLTAIKKPEDTNLSVSLTSNQMQSIAAFLSILIGAVASSFNIKSGIFVIGIIVHLFSTFYILF